MLQPALPGDTATFHTLPGAGEPSTSQKAWVGPYAEIPDVYVEVHVNPDLHAINGVFGSENELEEYLLNKDTYPSNDTVEWFQSEGDSVRTFYTHISHPIQLAFHPANITRPFIV